ncbi:MAG: molybdopterin biosynthesis protein [Desulforegulaceae bacterium]|nr:molybdopterin biosynthesis protein [Desulforegulaceae bacterium]
MERTIYLDKTDLETAKNTVLDHFKNYFTKTEKISSANSLGRILAEPVFARLSSPLFHVSAMDGAAVDSRLTFGASKTNPLRFEPGKNIFFVNTGEVLPENTDAVVIIEKINQIDETAIEIDEALFPWQNVRKTGEDIVATEMIFPSLHKISPQDICALLSGGVSEIKAVKKPVIAIIPTGSELIEANCPENEIRPGAVIESNSAMLCAFIEENMGIPLKLDPVKDDPEILANVLFETAKKNEIDIILTIGGSSAGSRDYTKKAIEKNGEILIHGISIMPGKPAIAGVINQKPVFGIPGYPVSAVIIFEMLIKPLIFSFLKESCPEKSAIYTYPSRNIFSKLGIEEFVRVKIGKVNNRFISAPLSGGAGTITSITEADGIIRIPSDTEGITDKILCRTELLRPESVIEKTVLMVGSHDNTIDILSGMMAEKNQRISSTHVGSMGGITAIKKGSAHIAGIHLLDTLTGKYNDTYLEKYIPEKKLKIIHLVSRYQGLIVQKKNPLKISSLKDLENKQIKFVNRQKGSGTRILTDYECLKNKIDSSKIRGFNLEEFTHMGVAVCVKSLAADAGMGIMAAARALDLDFIPVTKEDYEIIVPEEFFELEPIKILIEIINSKKFKNEVMKKGGYEVNRTGEIRNFSITM